MGGLRLVSSWCNTERARNLCYFISFVHAATHSSTYLHYSYLTSSYLLFSCALFNRVVHSLFLWLGYIIHVRYLSNFGLRYFYKHRCRWGSEIREKKTEEIGWTTSYRAIEHETRVDRENSTTTSNMWHYNPAFAGSRYILYLWSKLRLWLRLILAPRARIIIPHSRLNRNGLIQTFPWRKYRYRPDISGRNNVWREFR